MEKRGSLLLVWPHMHDAEPWFTLPLRMSTLPPYETMAPLQAAALTVQSELPKYEIIFSI